MKYRDIAARVRFDFFCRHVYMLVLAIALAGCSRTSRVVVYDFFDNLPSATVRSSRTDFRSVRQEFLNLQMDLRGYIEQPPGTVVSYYLRLPDRCYLQVGAGMDMISWTDTKGVDLSITVTPQGGTERRLISLYLNPYMNKDQSGWIDRKIDLAAYSGELVRIDFLSRCHADPLDSSRVGWARPQIIQKRESAWWFPDHDSHLTQRAESVYWFILDRLAVGDAGAYGSPSSRTPNLDRFSRRSMMLQGGLSPSDQFIRALGSIFTGLQSTEHGLLKRGKRYRSGVRTIASSLSQAPIAYRSLFLTNRMLTEIPFALTPDFTESCLLDEGSVPAGISAERYQAAQFVDKLRQWKDESGSKLQLVCTYQSVSPLASAGGSESDSEDGDTATIPTDEKKSGESTIASINDHILGLFLRTLHDLKLERNGSIIVSGIMGEYGRLERSGRSQSFDLTKLTTPLLLRLPALPRRQAIVPVYASGCDVVPTILDYLRVRPNRFISGTSLLPYLERGATTPWPHPLYIDHLPTRGGVLYEGRQVYVQERNGAMEYAVTDSRGETGELFDSGSNGDFVDNFLCQLFRERFLGPTNQRMIDYDTESFTSRWFD